MQKIIYSLFLLLVVANFAIAQSDTLLHQTFSTQFDIDPADLGTDGVSAIPNGNDTIWVNFDEDGLPAANGWPQEWVWDSLDFNDQSLGVMVSRSWLENFLPGNRNWLITPPIQIVDANAMLYWKSASYQGPRYMDGYTVHVSTTSNDATATPSPFTDMIFEAAEMENIIGNSESLLLADFQFSSGYIHANGYTDSLYFIDPTEDSTLSTFNLGLLEPHSVSLAAYAGQTIYIAFLHDSDDDNLLEIDDILVTGTAPVSTQKIELSNNVKLFPNPATDYLTISYDLTSALSVDVEIYNMQGQLVRLLPNVSNNAGSHQETISISDLPTGTYNIVLSASGSRSVKTFIKK